MFFIVIFPFCTEYVHEHTLSANVWYLFVKQKKQRRKMTAYLIKYNYCSI